MVGWQLDKTKSILNSTQVEVVVGVWLEKVLKINFHGWVGVVDQVEVEVVAELGNNQKVRNYRKTWASVKLSSSYQRKRCTWSKFLAQGKTKPSNKL